MSSWSITYGFTEVLVYELSNKNFEVKQEVNKKVW